MITLSGGSTAVDVLDEGGVEGVRDGREDAGAIAGCAVARTRSAVGQSRRQHARVSQNLQAEKLMNY